MKILLTLVSLIVAISSFSQKKMPVIKATSKNAYIKEGNEEKTPWTLSPEVKPDVYTLSKSPSETTVTLFTDIDSISVQLKPNTTFDCIVLLNGKDSCFTRFENPALKDLSKTSPEIHDTIPFVLTGFNSIKVKAVLDDNDTLYLNFDSGAGDFLLTNEYIQKTPVLKELENHRFRIGTQVWEKQEVYPVELSAQETDGRFGWNIFDGMIVEIDYDHNLMMVHSRLPRPSNDYAQLPIEYSHGLFCVRASLVVEDKIYANRFLFDNGYQRTIMLDKDIMIEQQFPQNEMQVIKKVIMKNGKGEDVPVLTVNNEQFILGTSAMPNIPVQLLATPNPARFKTHILGNEVLKRFNTILDFQHNMVYIKPNSLYNLAYTEQRSGGM